MQIYLDTHRSICEFEVYFLKVSAPWNKMDKNPTKSLTTYTRKHHRLWESRHYLKMNGMINNSSGCVQLHCEKCGWEFCKLVSKRTVGPVSTRRMWNQSSVTTAHGQIYIDWHVSSTTTTKMCWDAMPLVKCKVTIATSAFRCLLFWQQLTTLSSLSQSQAPSFPSIILPA